LLHQEATRQRVLLACKTSPLPVEALRRCRKASNVLVIGMRLSSIHSDVQPGKSCVAEPEQQQRKWRHSWKAVISATDARMDRALPSQYTIHIELNEGQKNEDKEDMDFMSMVSALSVESRNSAQASVLHSSFSGVSSLSGSKYNCASKAHSKGRDPKRKATPKQQLAQRRLSLYFQSRDCFRPSSSIYLDQPAQPKEEPGTVPCSATKVKDKSWMKQRILIYFTVLVLASLACAAQLVN